MTRLWLIGMMGTGKTSAGSRAADLLGVGFADTDEMVTTQAGDAISEIWARDGEGAFRDMEKEALASLREFRGIIATGGGAVLDAGNRDLIAGKVAWLQARPATILARLEKDDNHRPLLDGTRPAERTLAVILEERAPIYDFLATHRVVTDDREIDDIVEELAGIWRG